MILHFFRRTGFGRFVVFFIAIFVIAGFVFSKNANAIRVVANVNEDVITDYDIDEFANTLCQIDKRFKCGSIENKQMALFTYIETILKQEHIKSIGIDLKQFEEGYKEYKKKTLLNIKFSSKITNQFDTYLYNEYIWEIMISSQIKPEDITENMIVDFSKTHNIKVNKENRVKIINNIMQQKANELSKSMMADLKKYYFVDIMG